MSLDIFFDQFAELADAPNGVKKLRELILQLAVQGKLVPQDPNDEPASALLERIHAEKARGNGQRKLFDEEISDLEGQYDLPRGWEWARLGEVASLSTGYAFKSGDYESTGIFVLRVTNISERGTISKDDAVYIPKEKITPRIRNYYLQADDLLVVMVGGSLGKIGVVTDDLLPALLNQNMWRVKPLNEGLTTQYLLLALKYINTFQLRITHSTHGHLAMSEYVYQLIGLPPLAEQRRIVAKVDQLMALCDELEARQNERSNMRVRLNNSALDHLLTAQNSEDFALHWQRLHANFDLLYDRPEMIGRLRQGILQLAMQGKLVRQDPNDEPASVLLDKIRAEKVRLIKEGKLKQEKPLPAIAEDALLFELPREWMSICLGECTGLISGQHLGKEEQNGKEEGLPYLTGPADFGVINPIATRWTATRRAVAAVNDVLITVKGAGIGKSNILAMDEAAIGRQLMAIRSILIDYKYVYLLVLASYQKFQDLGIGSTVPGIGREDILEFPMGLPPLAEQRRIVAKVDQLMALCDELEAKLKDAQAMSERLVESVVHQVLAGGVTA